MVDEQNSTEDRLEIYQIRIGGHLDDQWTDWFGGATVTREEGGDTLLICRVIDQAALYGVLRQIRDLGVPLISVNRIPVNRIGPSVTTNDRSTTTT